MSKHLKKKKLEKSASLSQKGIFGVPEADDKMVMSIQEYRSLLDDHQSSDAIVKERINFLVSLCREVIISELKPVKNNEQS